MAFLRGKSIFLSKIIMNSIFLLVLTNMCFALYEDQVGLFDWKQQYIGNAKELSFEQSAHSVGSKRIIVSTESNVLASLNARTGQLIWRKLFEESNGVINNVFHSSEFLITVSNHGKVIRAWDQGKGHLIWETDTSPIESDINNMLDAEKILKGHKALILDEENGGLVVISNNMIKLISQADGSEIWTYEMPKDFVGQVIGVSKVQNNIVALSIQKKSNQIFINFKHLDLDSGELIAEAIIPAAWILQNDVACDLVSSKYLVCLNKEAFVILVKDYSNGSKEAFVGMDLQYLNIDKSEIFGESFVKSLSSSLGEDYFHLKVNNRHHVLAKINSENSQVQFIKEMFHPGLFTVGKLSSKSYIFEIYKDIKNNNLKVHIYSMHDLLNEDSTLSTVIPYSNQDFQGVPTHASVFMYSKKDEISYRVLISTEEHVLSLIQYIDKSEGKILWTRNEALARIMFAKMIELPPSTSPSKLELLHAEFSNVASSGIFTMFVNRIRSQIRQLQVFVKSLRKKQHYGEPANDISDDKNLKRDQFNILKVILAVTEGRKLFAINSQDGNSVWSRFLPDIQKYAGEPDFELIEQRTTAHFPYPPKCVIFAPHRNQTKSNGVTAIYSFNPLNGEGLDTPEIIASYKVLKVSELPFQDQKSSKVIGIVDTDHYFHIYPETEDTLTKFKEHMNSIYIYLVHKDSNTFKGYKIRAVDKTFKLYEVYTVSVPTDQTILKLTCKRSDETVNSVGRVLGDHTVLYKYLNPNVITFMTTQNLGNKGSVFVYVVDAVTGHVLYQARHKGARAPVDVILSEHWLVYMYYNKKGKRMEVSVVEFYEGYEEKNHTAFSSLDPIGAPMILSQGYVFPTTTVNTLASTNTRHGITNKNILIGLDNGYVYSLPKMFLDPRRNFQQTPVLQEEGVPPYMPELPLAAQGYINYNQTVPFIRGIHTSAAGLESTSLVLVYGLDLFFTRVTPSKMFDVLKEDFDYILISGVLSILILATIALGKLSSMKNLKAAWA